MKKLLFGLLVLFVACKPRHTLWVQEVKVIGVTYYDDSTQDAIFVPRGRPYVLKDSLYKGQILRTLFKTTRHRRYFRTLPK